MCEVRRHPGTMCSSHHCIWSEEENLWFVLRCTHQNIVCWWDWSPVLTPGSEKHLSRGQAAYKTLLWQVSLKALALYYLWLSSLMLAALEIAKIMLKWWLPGRQSDCPVALRDSAQWSRLFSQFSCHPSAPPQSHVLDNKIKFALNLGSWNLLSKLRTVYLDRWCNVSNGRRRNDRFGDREYCDVLSALWNMRLLLQYTRLIWQNHKHWFRYFEGKCIFRLNLQSLSCLIFELTSLLWYPGYSVHPQDSNKLILFLK